MLDNARVRPRAPAKTPGLAQKLSSMFASEAFIEGKSPNLPDKEMTDSEPVRSAKIGPEAKITIELASGKQLKERKGGSQRKDDRTCRIVCRKKCCACLKRRSIDINNGVFSGAAYRDGGRKATYDASFDPPRYLLDCDK